MVAQRIRELLDSLPPKSPIYTEGPFSSVRESHGVVINRAAHALRDPSFPWKYAMVFVGMRKSLPAVVYERYLRQAYDFAVVGTPHIRRLYRHIVNAEIFRHRTWRYDRQLLEALLIIPDLTLAAIANLANTDVDTVQCYENLFFNVRDRLDDKLYINRIVYPMTRHVENTDNHWKTQDPGQLMMQAAYTSGLDAVLRIYGINAGRVESSPEALAEQLKTRVLAQALHMAETGGLNQADSPVLKQAFKQLGTAGKKDEPKTDTTDSEMGLGAVGMTHGESILATLAGLTDDSYYNKMRKLQEDQNAESAGT